MSSVPPQDARPSSISEILISSKDCHDSASAALERQLRSFVRCRADFLADAGLLQLLIVGSVASKEASNQPNHSDVDLVAIYCDHAETNTCIALTSALRAKLSDDIGSTFHAGLRWRRVRELNAFFRHLSLFGFHCHHAIPLLPSSSLELPVTQVHRPDFDEYFCVFAECLWGEIRMRKFKKIEASELRYVDSKYALFYLSLLLATRGIFLPTHSQRAARWQVINPSSGIDIDAILDGKSGAARGNSASACAVTVDVLRDLALEAMKQLPRISYSENYPLLFWVNQGEEKADAYSRQIASVVASSLYHRLTEKQILPPRFSEKNAWLTEFLLQLAGGGRQMAVGLHNLRINHSWAARRDWGHVVME